MAKDTPKKIRKAASLLFAERWFETVSVVEICRQADVSNGVFYRYYKNKTELVKDLLDEFMALFSESLDAIGGDSVEERLSSFIQAVFDVGTSYTNLVTIFREGQYRFPEYEEQLRQIYTKCCESIYQRPVSEAEYLYVVAGLRFNSTRALYNGMSRHPELIARFISRGIFEGDVFDENALNIPETFPVLERAYPRESRESLMTVGMDLFGEKGYHSIGVSDIASKADLAVGTFYTYFKSKEIFVSEIIELIGKQTRHYLSSQAKTYGSRLEQEVHGVWHFLSYFSNHTEYYEIIREAEFIAKAQVRKYYDDFEAGYMNNLDISDREIRKVASNFLMGIAHYTGIEVLMTKRITEIPRFLGELAKLMQNGINP